MKVLEQPKMSHIRSLGTGADGDRGYTNSQEEHLGIYYGHLHKSSLDEICDSLSWSGNVHFETWWIGNLDHVLK
jgi:hypothetical protein